MSAVHAGPQDVLVIGGGVAGLSVAWRAARRGLRVAVADERPGGGAARVAAGMLAPVSEVQYAEQELLRLNLAAVDYYPEFITELEELTGRTVGYRRCGALAVAFDADDRAELRELHTFQERLGLDSAWLAARATRQLEPMLAPTVRGGLLVEGDHQVDGRRLLAALLDACTRQGVRWHEQSVTELLHAGGQDSDVTGVRLADGTEVAAGQTVLACGAYSGSVGGLDDAFLPPVRPVKGQVLRLRVPRRYRPLLSRIVRAVVRGTHLYLVPRLDGELVVGATSEEQGFDQEVTAGGVYQLLRDAHTLLPTLGELPLDECCAGLRPGTPDNAPLLGPSELAGLVLATGQHRNGVLLSPLTGELLAELLSTGQTPAGLLPFSPSRFSLPDAAPSPGVTPHSLLSKEANPR